MATRTAVMEAVEKLNYRVTIGDVAAQSGLDLNTAQREILALASETGGNLQVAESGEIAYKFAPNFRQILVSRSFWLQVQEWLKGVWKWVFYAIRISFGILLIVSIVIVVLGIIAATIALNSQKGNDRDDRRDSRDNGGGGFIWLGGWGNPFGNPFIMFDPYYYEPERIRQRDPDEIGFLESVFSFLFGDGNPNSDLEERRWREIATMIRSNNGVVVAEQIAPYLDETSRLEGDEYFVIPVLSKFNGFPEVSDAGTLAYKFPDLQKVASERKAKTTSSYLQEKLWKFSQAPQGKIALAIGLGIFYLVASLYLGSLINDPRLAKSLVGFLGFIKAAYGFLLGYAVLFLSTPAVRYFVLQYLNGGISDRNQKRAARAEQLKNASSTLREKLDFARTFAMKQEAIDQSNLAYTTEQDLADQEYAKMLKENKDT
ncbi:hypothetical protein H6F42_03370 [Pseudanabaena sp. FACHB-1998]|uniref:hypothetical protein n=1 Tax=Pseudanabaena sp. FACHB-1998 TaxID=2692858 RepID=UPI0016800042|nr:hypothetical protein [Pseudanabaena sp. FACHB-1998]MBD2175959.1 hypothetical protein [Pseudanabaena sp. FACHB-1998]